MANWKSIFTSKDKIRTELIKNELIVRGINAIILDKIDGSFQVFGTIQINVPEAQAELAQSIIEQLNLNDQES